MDRAVTIAWALVLLLAVPGAGAAEEAPRVAQLLPAPEHVTAETRAELHARMGRHAETMSNLIRSVVLLDRSTIRTLASRIADDEIIARSNKTSLEARRLNLPQEFFAEQTTLSVSARALALAAADGGDDAALADRFSTLTRTCVSCHSVYLHGRTSPHSAGPKAK